MGNITLTPKVQINDVAVCFSLPTCLNDVQRRPCHYCHIEAYQLKPDNADMSHCQSHARSSSPHQTASPTFYTSPNPPPSLNIVTQTTHFPLTAHLNCIQVSCRGTTGTGKDSSPATVLLCWFFPSPDTAEAEMEASVCCGNGSRAGMMRVGLQQHQESHHLSISDVFIVCVRKNEKQENSPHSLP